MTEDHAFVPPTSSPSALNDEEHAATVARALGFVAEYQGDPRCSLNCVHAEALAREIHALRHDIHAYRGALGYAVPGHHDGTLSNGNTPICGMCDARSRVVVVTGTMTPWTASSFEDAASYETDKRVASVPNAAESSQRDKGSS